MVKKVFLRNFRLYTSVLEEIAFFLYFVGKPFC